MSANTPESKVKKKVREWLKAHGIWFYPAVAGPFSVHGIPDYMCVLPPHGRVLGIEVKAPGKRSNTTANQEARMQEIRNHGGIAVVVDDVKQLEEILA